MSSFDVAMVGCGAISAAHAAAIAKHREARLTAAVDVDPAARERAEREWGVIAYATVGEMLEAQSPSVAVVCTPPALHAGSIEPLMAAGLDVLCEKPLATDSAIAAGLEAAAEERGRVLMTSAKFRFDDTLNEAARWIAEGAIGRPVYYEVTFCAPVKTAGGWTARPEVSGGGVVMDNGPHALDVLSGVLESPIVRVGAAFSRRTHSPEVEDTAEVQFVTDAGTAGRIGLSWTYYTKDLDYLMVQGTEGGLRVGWQGGALRATGEREWRPFGTAYDKQRAFSRQFEAFISWSKGGRAPRELGEAGDARRAVGVIEAIYSAESAREWRSVPRLGVAARNPAPPIGASR